MLRVELVGELGAQTPRVRGQLVVGRARRCVVGIGALGVHLEPRRVIRVSVQTQERIRAEVVLVLQLEYTLIVGDRIVCVRINRCERQAAGGRLRVEVVHHAAAAVGRRQQRTERGADKLISVEVRGCPQADGVRVGGSAELAGREVVDIPDVIDVDEHLDVIVVSVCARNPEVQVQDAVAILDVPDLTQLRPTENVRRGRRAAVRVIVVRVVTGPIDSAARRDRDRRRGRAFCERETPRIGNGRTVVLIVVPKTLVIRAHAKVVGERAAGVCASRLKRELIVLKR